MCKGGQQRSKEFQQEVGRNQKGFKVNDDGKNNSIEKQIIDIIVAGCIIVGVYTIEGDYMHYCNTQEDKKNLINNENNRQHYCTRHQETLITYRTFQLCRHKKGKKNTKVKAKLYMESGQKSIMKKDKGNESSL